VSEKAIAASKHARLPRAYWGWDDIIAMNKHGYFPYTPATNLLYGLHEAIEMLLEEGLDNVFARHDRHAEATRRAVRAWGLDVLCRNPSEYSSSLTAIVMPEGHDADAFRKEVLSRYDMSLGTGLGRLAGRVFRIGHLGFFNDLTLCGTLCGVEMGLSDSQIPHRKGGVNAALDYLGRASSSGDRAEERHLSVA
jgi:alanine-glyoxylate transaminase/serine-glyoxylate transaminase/serine-pyruvate transaminase